ncbi:MAG: PEP-CTERM system histidine kinase PrsK [Gammaproteobacteria bacterium]|nr:PEP-CTERM system histidine kinase PrsK [Gammaproteobacteria bacterium]
MTNPGFIGYLGCAVAFLVLSMILKSSWQGKRQGGVLLIAVIVSILWAAVAAYQATTDHPMSVSLAVIEMLRDAAWIAFLLTILFTQAGEASSKLPLKVTAFVVMAVVLVAEGVLSYIGLVNSALLDGWVFDLLVFSHIVVAVAGLILVEQLFRNGTSEQRWSLKYLCFGIGGLFAYDFYLYAEASLLQKIDLDVWAARGFVNIMVVPLIAVSAARNPQWSLDVYVSRQFVFHTTTLMGAGIYLIAMAAGGYYIRLHGGNWGGVAQLIFLFGAIVVLALLLFSGQMRARSRVFLSKHFFNYRYDYREEWMRLINTLSGQGLDERLRDRVVQAVAEIVESPGGVLWQCNDQRNCQMMTTLNMPLDENNIDTNDNASLVQFLKAKRWVIDIGHYIKEPAVYGELELPGWLKGLQQAWLVIPLLQQANLYGFIVLARGRATMTLNWEDRELLVTTGRQAANYLALLDTNDALMGARQFETFNRLSAYVVHDLKNVVAQLALVVKNAEKHKNNPEFVVDAIRTVDNAVNKMNRMLAQLRKGRHQITEDKQLQIVCLESVICDAVEHRSVDRPIPLFDTQEQGVKVLVDEDRLMAVVEHLIQNAQEATSKNGFVKVRLFCSSNHAVVEIADNGCGMDAQFIRDRLFKPFDTTKGNAGMGIGVYESREFISSMGGQFAVTSEPGMGTTFRIRLKIYQPEESNHINPAQTIEVVK